MPTSTTILAPGLVLFQLRLSATEQRDVWQRCRELADGPVPMYTPSVRGGRKMSVGMLCLGRHWNGMTYTYQTVGRGPMVAAPGATAYTSEVYLAKIETHEAKSDAPVS